MNLDVSKFARDYSYVKTKIAIGVEESVRGRTDINTNEVFSQTLDFVRFHLSPSTVLEEYRLLMNLIEDIEKTVPISMEAKVVFDEIKKLILSSEIHAS
jgi:hypothetical protein